MSTTAELREILDQEKLQLLTAIFDHFAELHEWIPERALHKQFGGKEKVRPALQEIGGRVVFLSEDTRDRFRRYELTLLGMLLTQHGPKLEKLLATYLSFARAKAIQDPQSSGIRSSEAAEGMRLDSDQVKQLGWLLSQAHQFRSGGSYSEVEWAFEFPDDVEDIPEDTISLVRQVVADDFDQEVPLDSKDRQAALTGRARVDSNRRTIEDREGEYASRTPAGARVADTSIEGSPDTFRAIMESIGNRLGRVWIAPNGERLEFSEKRRIVTYRDTDGSLFGGMGGRITGTRREDATPSTRASWVVTSSRGPTEQDIEKKRLEIQEELGASEDKVQRFLDRLKRVAGIEVYETQPNQLHIQFLDGYEPYSKASADMIVPIGAAFAGFANFILEDLPQEPSDTRKRPTSWIHDNIAKELSATPFLDDEDVEAAHTMADLYAILHCYENSVRRLVDTVLQKGLGTEWWHDVASGSMQRAVRERIAREEKEKWLSPRGGRSPLYYLDWGDLEKIMRKKEELFVQHIGSLRFIESRFGDLESLRNIVAHNGTLPSVDDFNRALISFRDWRKQMQTGAKRP